MADSLNAKTQEQMQALCKKISVAHDLDPEIQDELYGHMEDKLLAYLNGEEPVTEDDAFILVREHFGDPAVLKGLLQDVHAYEVHVSLARRLTAAAIVTTATMFFSFFLMRLVFLLWKDARGFGGFHACFAVAGIANVVLPWLLLWLWQRRLDAGHRPWFLTWRPLLLASIVIVLMAMTMLVHPMLLLSTEMTLMWSPFIWRLILVAAIVSPVLQCLVWLWWCDRPPRMAMAVRNAAGAWTLWYFVSAMSLSLASGTEDVRRIILSLAFTFLYMVICAVIAGFLYVAAKYFHRNFAKTLTTRLGDFKWSSR